MPANRVRRLCRSTFLVATATSIAIVPVGGSSYASTQTSYLSILNQERVSHGLAPLHVNADLTNVADAWAARMGATRWLRHNPALTSEVRNWQSVGENVGDGADLRDLANAFWASAEHRHNILDPDFTDVGIGAVVADHRLWLAVVFREPLHRAAAASPQRGASRTTEQPWSGRLLTLGTTGSAVAELQRLLGLPATGVFGARTQQAVFGFQRSHQLTVDGIVGALTWAALVRAAS